MVLLGIHHVDVLAGDQLGFGDGVVLAGHQLVADVLVVELLEDVDVLGDDLRMVLPADEAEGVGRGGQRAPGEAGNGQGRGGGEAALQDGAAIAQVAIEANPTVCVHGRAPPNDA